MKKRALQWREKNEREIFEVEFCYKALILTVDNALCPTTLSMHSIAKHVI